jgi:hypothetical protein
LRVELSSAMIGAMSMIVFKRTLAAALVLAVLASLGLPAQAAEQWWPRHHHRARGCALHTVAERRVRLAQAIEAVQRATGGKVLDAGTWAASTASRCSPAAVRSASST